MAAGQVWAGRDDGPGAEHRRFFHAVHPAPGPDGADGQHRAGRTDVALFGFASDEGVRRNHGRVGAATGPHALRDALASLALHAPLTVADHGDITVERQDLEAAQTRLGAALTRAHQGDTPPLTVVLGGGHESAYASYLGLAGRAGHGAGFGILNLDAHFDLRSAPRPSSGTPFLQAIHDEASAGRALPYAVAGVSEANNTTALFDTARRHAVPYLLDDDCWQPGALEEFVGAFLDRVEEVYLTIDLDVLPAAVAPGVSAPAALGVPLHRVQAACDLVADSGKLAHLDVVELCPPLDVDARTARAAARLIHRIITRAVARRGRP